MIPTADMRAVHRVTLICLVLLGGCAAPRTSSNLATSWLSPLPSNLEGIYLHDESFGNECGCVFVRPCNKDAAIDLLADRNWERLEAKTAKVMVGPGFESQGNGYLIRAIHGLHAATRLIVRQNETGDVWVQSTAALRLGTASPDAYPVVAYLRVPPQRVYVTFAHGMNW